MSTGPKITRPEAVQVLALLGREVGLSTATGAAVVGSFRRGYSTLGDIELIAPLPVPDDSADIDVAPGTPDPLYEALCTRFERPAPATPPAPPPKPKATTGNLFAAPSDPTPTPPKPAAAPAFDPDRRLGSVNRGLNHGFRLCSLALEVGNLRCQVEIYRYNGGPRGNRGLIEMIRTGPGEFGKQLMIELGLLGYTSQTFIRDPDGQPIPTPNEQSLWDLLRIAPIEPKDRSAQSIQRACSERRRVEAAGRIPQGARD